MHARAAACGPDLRGADQRCSRGGLGCGRVPAQVMPRVLHHARASGSQTPGSLNDRERSVLRLLAEGSDTRGIASGLCFSERTVKNVVHDVLTKLNCRTRAQAVAAGHPRGRDLSAMPRREPWAALADTLLQREALICRLAEGRAAARLRRPVRRRRGRRPGPADAARAGRARRPSVAAPLRRAARTRSPRRRARRSPPSLRRRLAVRRALARAARLDRRRGRGARAAGRRRAAPAPAAAGRATSRTRCSCPGSRWPPSPGSSANHGHAGRAGARARRARCAAAELVEVDGARARGPSASCALPPRVVWHLRGDARPTRRCRPGTRAGGRAPRRRRPTPESAARQRRRPGEPAARGRSAPGPGAGLV